MCNAAWKGFDLQIVHIRDQSHQDAAEIRRRVLTLDTWNGHSEVRNSLPGQHRSFLWHVQGRKLSCLLTFSQQVCWGGFSGCIGSRAQLNEFTQIWPLILGDLLTWLKCNCSDHCSITRPLEGWASAASWSPAMAKGALAPGCLESEVKNSVKSWHRKDEN